MEQSKNKSIIPQLFLLGTLVMLLVVLQGADAAPPTKFDYLTKDYQECGLVSCATYYTAKNPTTNDFTIDPQKMKVSSYIQYVGESKGFTIQVWNITSYANLQDMESVTVRAGETLKVRVIGGFTPIIVKEGKQHKLSYSIDHIPEFMGYTFPEYDLWNQTFQQCFDMNITYTGDFTTLNESFPQRVLLNSTIVNTSRIRSDWGDLRFGKGTCANVTADYSHAFVYKNSTAAEAVVQLNSQDIVNNTPARVAVYYNSTTATHIDPAESGVGWGGSGASNLKVRLFTNDKTTDNATSTTTIFNDTGFEYELKSFGNTSLTRHNIWALTKRINSSTSGLYFPLFQGSEDGLSISTRFTLYNVNQTGNQYIATTVNHTDVTSTGMYEIYLTGTNNTAFPYENVSMGWEFNDGGMSVTNKGGVSATGTAAISGTSPKLGNGSFSNGGAAGSYTNLSTTGFTTSGNVNFAIAGWVNLASNSTAQLFFDYDYTGPAGRGIALLWIGGASNQLRCATHSSATDFDVVLTQGTWHHVMCIKSGSTYQMYINGVNTENITDATALSVNSTGRVRIGSDGGNHLNGKIDNLMFWNSSLSRTQALAVYNSGTGREFSSASSGVTQTLTFKAYYVNQTKTSTVTLSQLQNNVSYPVSLTMRKLQGTPTIARTTFIFNNTVVLRENDTLSDSTIYRENSTSCSKSAAPDLCTNFTVLGARPYFTTNGTIYNMVDALNGSIDEVISANINSGITDRFDKEFLIAWGSIPTMSFSPTLTSNIFTPNVSLSINPSSVTFLDNTNASVLYTDLDPSNGTVVIQWRVNGSIVRTTTFQNVISGQTVSDVLNSAGNYSKGATLNVTAWANDSLYFSNNQSIQVLVGGIRPNPITALACGFINKTAINCNWTNPVANHNITKVFRNGTNLINLTNASVSYNFTGLSPNNTYNLSFITVSFDGTDGNTTWNVTGTQPNFGPVITGYNPTNLTPTFAEDTNQTFNVTATDDDGSPIITWFLDNVVQTVANFWTWVIGKNEQGTHNVTVIVNDTYGAQTQMSWNVTVTDDYPAPDAPTFSPNGGLYRTYIPLSCVSENGFSAVEYYNIQYSVNGGAYSNLSTENRYGAVDFDITQYDYYTNFTFNCTAIGESGNVSSISNTFTRDYVNEFYSTTLNTNFKFNSLQEYPMSLYYDAENPDNNIFVQYAYSDCNGDGEYDYVYNYTTDSPSRLKTYYTCVYPKGVVNYEIGVFITKITNTSWKRSGCSTDYDYSDTCLVKKVYQLEVS